MTLSINLAQINQAAGTNQALRETLTAMMQAHQAMWAQTGTGPLQKVDSAANKNLGPPAQCGLSVAGANGSFTVNISLPQQSSGSSKPGNSTNAPIYQQISSSTTANFSTGITTYPVSTGTSFVFPNPGATLYWRLRSSYDQTTWNSYTYAGAVSAGLQTSAASEPATALNTTNFAHVDSVGAGGSATIRVYGSGGTGTSWTATSGQNSKVIPAGTIMNVAYGSTQFVAWDGSKYQVKANLAQVLPDSWIPVGSCSVIANGSGLTLPTIAPVIEAGHIIGYNITNGGNDITGTLTFTITDTVGTGATVGPATVTNGVLTALGAGNPGSGYSGATTVTASGGISGGTAGGGQATGNNGGRLFGVTTNGV